MQVRVVAIGLIGFLIWVPTLAASPGGAGKRGPDGFGNIPYGSSSEDAIRLNHGNGEIVQNNGPPILTYRTSIQGMTFNVTQNYDKNHKAVDAIVVSTTTESGQDCIAQFNYVLALLQSTYGEAGSAPLQEQTGGNGVSYKVLFEFNRSDGIEAELTAAGTGGSATGSGAGPCTIRLHYLPPGWVGHF
ncbi:MAG TPA: hypothetical protein VMU81_17660 [Acetobacteraceae bacterium]|jgi:hypothetical protein|nr:hypothetical protein [Acetobacteraceae bacterium]